MRITYEGERLYCRYPRQTTPQPVHVVLDCEGETLGAESDPEIGGAVSAAVWHGRIRRYAVPCLRPELMATLLDEILPLAERVVAGYESRWNGSRWVGRLDEDAEEAEQTIEARCDARCDAGDLLPVWQAEDWFGARADRTCRDLGITAATTDEDLDRIEEAEEVHAEADDAILDGLREYLGWLRDHAPAAEESE